MGHTVYFFAMTVQWKDFDDTSQFHTETDYLDVPDDVSNVEGYIWYHAFKYTTERAQSHGDTGISDRLYAVPMYYNGPTYRKPKGS